MSEEMKPMPTAYRCPTCGSLVWGDRAKFQDGIKIQWKMCQCGHSESNHNAMGICLYPLGCQCRSAEYE